MKVDWFLDDNLFDVRFILIIRQDLDKTSGNKRDFDGKRAEGSSAGAGSAQ